MARRRKAGPAPAGLIVPDAFVRGIRDLGYRSNADSIAEFIDNAVQAHAERIDLLFDYELGGSTRRPIRLAVIDDGNGMSPETIRLAVRWGGTDRENNRDGLGRYGFGLPCAAVSLGRRYTVYSRTADGPTYALTIDLDQIAAGQCLDGGGNIAIPTPTLAELPPFITKHIADERDGQWPSGTVVVIDQLDRLQWVTARRLTDALFTQLGVIYHKLLADVALYVDGRRVEPIDPLFLSPGFRFYDLDQDRAESFDPVHIEVSDPVTAGRLGAITLRYAWFPPSFGSVDKAREAVGLNANPRFSVIKGYHGILFSRNGRLVDVQARTPWTTFINNDRYIKVEVEFSASLDEFFGVTTSKQQVTVSPFIWDVLYQAGVPKAVEQLRNKLREAKVARRGQLLGVGLYDALQPDDEVGNSIEQGQLAFRSTPHRLIFEAAAGQPFFTLSRESGNPVLRLNIEHRFFEQIYAAPHCTDEMRAALELMLRCAVESIPPNGSEPVLTVNLSTWSRQLDEALAVVGEATDDHRSGENARSD